MNNIEIILHTNYLEHDILEKCYDQTSIIYLAILPLLAICLKILLLYIIPHWLHFRLFPL